MKRKLRIAAVLVVVAAVAGWYFLLRESPSENGTLVLYGNVDIRQVKLGFRVNGRIVKMHFEEGDKVPAGAVIAELGTRPYNDELRLAQAEVAAQAANVRKFEAGLRPAEIARSRAIVAERKATLQNTILRLERRARLIRAGHTSKEAYDDALADKVEAEARLRSAQKDLDLALEGFRKEDIEAARANLGVAKARLAKARTSLADTKILAPTNGIILSRIEEPGAIVAAGTPVYTMTLTDHVWVRTYVSEPNLGRVHPGMKVTVTTDSAPDKRYTGHVGFISPVAEFTPKSVETADLRTDLVYRLRVIIDNPDRGLRQGMPVTARLVLTANKE